MPIKASNIPVKADQSSKYWTNASVREFAGEFDPIERITTVAREKVLSAIQAGWQGPPFDPFKLADLLGIRTVPRDDVLDARIVPVGAQHLQVEFNPNRPRGRVRFSIAHEIAHSLFPDCINHIRNRGKTGIIEDDQWQLELLCNMAAAEFLMPVGTEIDTRTSVTMDNILRLQHEFDVSTEAISIRLAKVTTEPCTVFSAARVVDVESSGMYRLDYSIPSRTSTIDLPRGLKLSHTIISQCTAVGYTAKGVQRDVGGLGDLYMECVGIMPYPGNKYPRVIVVAHSDDDKPTEGFNIVTVRGNALETRGVGPKIIAQIVNDKTPNWGAGFARAVRTKYPEVQLDFKNWANDQPRQFSLGNVHITKVSKELYVVNMIAQHGYGESTKPRIRYVALRQCLQQLKEIALREGASIHMPRIGTGYAGGNWSYIMELIDEILAIKGIDVTIYTLPNYDPNETQGSFPLAKNSI
jgi:O-acetyl-ADP-ribose deacetylase (regulator of RNase III)